MDVFTEQYLCAVLCYPPFHVMYSLCKRKLLRGMPGGISKLVILYTLDAFLQADHFGHRNTKRNEGLHVSLQSARGKTKQRHGLARSTSLTQYPASNTALYEDQCGQYGCPASIGS